MKDEWVKKSFKIIIISITEKKLKNKTDIISDK